MTRDRVSEYLLADHERLETLLTLVEARGGPIDFTAYTEFRAGLLRHIGMEEKTLPPAAQRARGGEPLPAAALLRFDHGALAALLVPPPTSAILSAIRAILARHHPIEEGPGGVYETCARFAGPDIERLVAELRASPLVRVSPLADDERAVSAARRALARAGYDAAVMSI